MGCCASHDRRLADAADRARRAIEDDDAQGLRRILRFTPGFDVHTRVRVGRTWTGLLHLAARESAHGCASLLLRAGTTVDARDARGWTPLHYATVYQRPPGDVRVLRALLRAGASLDAETTGGGSVRYRGMRIRLSRKTPYQLACDLLCYDACEVLA